MTALQSGHYLTIIDVHSAEDISRVANSVTTEKTDVIILPPCAPVSKVLESLLRPFSLE